MFPVQCPHYHRVPSVGDSIRPRGSPVHFPVKMFKLEVVIQYMMYTCTQSCRVPFGFPEWILSFEVIQYITLYTMFTLSHSRFNQWYNMSTWNSVHFSTRICKLEVIHYSTLYICTKHYTILQSLFSLWFKTSQ